MQVTSDGTTQQHRQRPCHRRRSFTTAKLVRGNLNASVTSVGTITNFIINKGSVNAGRTVQSTLGNIANFKVTGGTLFGMFGSLLASNGANENINISGNMGDGVDAPASLP